MFFYRDVIFIWAVILQVGFFITPIIYPLDIFPPALQDILRLNPIAQIIITTRDSILYSTISNPLSLLYIGICSIIVLIIGYTIFIEMEPRFAEEM